MAIKVGDKVRFLSATGGGVVSRVVSKELIEVTDADGFDIPTLVHECVVVESADKKEEQKNREQPKEDPVETPVEPEEEYLPEETPEGENLNVWLAFVPMNSKLLSSTSYDFYLVNDSNYYLAYNITNGNGALFKSRKVGFIQPNTKIFIEEVKKEQLNDLEQLTIQLFAFKRDKAYSVRPVYDVPLQINPVKFYKLHSFVENDFFDEPALLFQLIHNNRRVERPITVPDELSQQVMQHPKEEETPSIPPVKKKEQPEIIEVDLHINQLLDNLNGLSNADMLRYQLDKFHQVIRENEKWKGQKIVFIHGKGEGILRNEIMKQLKTKYPTYYVQDASFREYGFGATMIIIK